MRILAGDVGGTNARLALVEAGAGALRITAEERLPSGDYPGLEDLLRAFLDRHGAPAVEAAAFGLPGPVLGDRVRTTNLPWEVEAGSLGLVLGTARVRLLNDLEAAARGIAELAPADVETLAAGESDSAGNRALIAAGTGLGEAGMFWDGARHRPFATEGGHADFAPADELDRALHRYLAECHGHVSWEHVVSGPGLVRIHAFLAAHRGRAVPGWLEAAMAEGDPAAAIAAAAEDGSDPLCAEAMERFVRHYGAEAGNLALKLMATGGVYLGGGIAPRIAARLREPAFLEAFRAKGAMAPLLERIPVRLIHNDHAALLGAARHAASA
ncbi:MAG: glucokinase [Thiohalorhabdus sp.]